MFLCLTVLAAALAADLTRGSIPPALTLMGVMLSQVSVIVRTGSVREALFALLGGILLAATLFPLFAIGAMGGGDIKLIIMLPGFLGLGGSYRLCFICFVIASVIGTIRLIRRGIFMERMKHLAGYIRRMGQEGRVVRYDIPLSVRGEIAAHQIYFTEPLFAAACMIALYSRQMA